MQHGSQFSMYKRTKAQHIIKKNNEIIEKLTLRKNITTQNEKKIMNLKHKFEK